MKVDLSPRLASYALIAAGLMACYLLAGALDDAIKNMRFQTVYGEQADAPIAPISAKALALPVVEASLSAEEVAAGQSDDQQIESAFAQQLKVPEYTKEPEVAPPTLSQQFFMTYRPTIQGVAGHGAFVRGQFWSVGEPIRAMPLRANDGQIVYPKIVQVSPRGVAVEIQGQTLTLPVFGVH